jgi:hypothetical protein
MPHTHSALRLFRKTILDDKSRKQAKLVRKRYVHIKEMGKSLEELFWIEVVEEKHAEDIGDHTGGKEITGDFKGFVRHR